jgi:flavin reductase (DIM6/NTAB) family NADH-FMN oxidoreductase RutF
VCKQISSKDKRVRWVGVESERTPSGAIFLKDAAMAFECALHAQYPAGDHDMVLLLVGSFDTNSSREPLVFHGSQFRRLEAVR